MVPSNLKVLAKFGLCSNCSLAKLSFASARMLGFSLKFPARVGIICILKTKTDTGNSVSGMGNWETLGEHVRAMKVSGKMLPRLVDIN